MNTNNAEETAVSFPRTVRLLDQEVRAAAICRKYNVKPVDFIRHAVQRFSESVEAAGRYDTPPVDGSAPLVALNLRRRAELAKKENANRRSSGGAGSSRAARR